MPAQFGMQRLGLPFRYHVYLNANKEQNVICYGKVHFTLLVYSLTSTSVQDSPLQMKFSFAAGLQINVLV